MDDFANENGRQHSQNENEKIGKSKIVSPDGIKHLMHANSALVIEQTPERNVSDRVPCEMDNVVATVETRV